MDVPRLITFKFHIEIKVSYIKKILLFRFVYHYSSFCAKLNSTLFVFILLIDAKLFIDYLNIVFATDMLLLSEIVNNNQKIFVSYWEIFFERQTKFTEHSTRYIENNILLRIFMEKTLYCKFLYICNFICVLTNIIKK